MAKKILNTKEKKEQFLKDYKELGSVTTLSEKWKISIPSAYQNLKRLGIEFKARGRASKVTPEQQEQFIRDYESFNRNASALSRKWNISPTAAVNTLRKFGATIRKPGRPKIKIEDTTAITI
jgi:DNA-binding transcriptional regulator YhcF (GntR family)